MNLFTLSESKRTPEVLFNLDNAELVFNGNSIPEDVNLFYAPLISWIEVNKDHIIQDSRQLMIKVNLVYFNSATLKFLVSLLKFLINIKGVDLVKISWLYDHDDDDMLETAKDISNILSIPINYILRD